MDPNKTKTLMLMLEWPLELWLSLSVTVGPGGRCCKTDFSKINRPHLRGILTARYLSMAMARRLKMEL